MENTTDQDALVSRQAASVSADIEAIDLSDERLPVVVAAASDDVRHELEATSIKHRIIERMEQQDTVDKNENADQEAVSVSEKIAERFSAIERNAVRPWAHAIQEIDPESSVFIAGSFKNNVENIRTTSDLDIIVFSMKLKDPEMYVASLKEFSALCIAEADNMGNVPAFFTKHSEEDDIIEITALHRGVSFKDVIPCHFLYYANEREYSQREPGKLTATLLRSAEALTRHISPEAMAVPLAGTTGMVDEKIWDVERALADFVLNKEILSPCFRRRKLCNTIFNQLRDMSYLYTAQISITDTLDILSKYSGSKLVRDYDMVLSVRRDPEFAEAQTDEPFEDFTCRFLKGLTSLRQDIRKRDLARYSAE